MKSKPYLVFFIVFTIIIFLSILAFSMGRRPEPKMAEKNEIKLPAPKSKGEMSLEESIKKRKSIRSFKEKELTLEQISQILWSSQGLTHGYYRAAPSAGAFYPLEVYIAKSDGVYRYVPEEHKLVTISSEDKRTPLALAALGQMFIARAPVVIVIAAVYSRTKGKYGERGDRYVHIEVGHAAENIHLQAVSLGLGSVPIGAFWDEQVKRTLSLPKNHEPLYIIPVGYPR